MKKKQTIRIFIFVMMLYLSIPIDVSSYYHGVPYDQFAVVPADYTPDNYGVYDFIAESLYNQLLTYDSYIFSYIKETYPYLFIGTESVAYDRYELKVNNTIITTVNVQSSFYVKINKNREIISNDARNYITKYIVLFDESIKDMNYELASYYTGIILTLITDALNPQHYMIDGNKLMNDTMIELMDKLTFEIIKNPSNISIAQIDSINTINNDSIFIDTKIAENIDNVMKLYTDFIKYKDNTDNYTLYMQFTNDFNTILNTILRITYTILYHHCENATIPLIYNAKSYRFAVAFPEYYGILSAYGVIYFVLIPFLLKRKNKINR